MEPGGRHAHCSNVHTHARLHLEHWWPDEVLKLLIRSCSGKIIRPLGQYVLDKWGPSYTSAARQASGHSRRHTLSPTPPSTAGEASSRPVRKPLADFSIGISSQTSGWNSLNLALRSLSGNGYGRQSSSDSLGLLETLKNHKDHLR